MTLFPAANGQNKISAMSMTYRGVHLPQSVIHSQTGKMDIFLGFILVRLRHCYGFKVQRYIPQKVVSAGAFAALKSARFPL